METVANETKSGIGAEAMSRAASCLGEEMEDAVKRFEKAMKEAKMAASSTLEGGKDAAARLLKRGRRTVEDSIDEAAHQVKRHPLGSLAAAFAFGAVAALVLPRMSNRK